MRYQRPAIIGASLLAFGAAVAFMLPPTKPIGGAKITSIANQGFSPVKSAAPSQDTPNYSDTGNKPPMAMAATEPTTNEAADDGDSAQTPSASSPRSAARQSAHADPRYASADDDEDRSGYYYKQGYRWAQRADVQSPRDCRVLAGTQIDGCQAYLHDARERRDDRDDRDGDEGDRPY